jgi:hypothetical protein
MCPRVAPVETVFSSTRKTWTLRAALFVNVGTNTLRAVFTVTLGNHVRSPARLIYPRRLTCVQVLAEALSGILRAYQATA